MYVLYCILRTVCTYCATAVHYVLSDNYKDYGWIQKQMRVDQLYQLYATVWN